MKRGLAIIYDPHALMQFIKFYCMHDYVAEWDALCLPKEDGKEEMHTYCERTGLFKTVYTGEVEYKSLSLFCKLNLFIRMMFYAVTGKKKRFCIKELVKYVKIQMFTIYM